MAGTRKIVSRKMVQGFALGHFSCKLIVRETRSNAKEKKMFVVYTKTGFTFHYSTDKKTTLCGSKVKGSFGTVGTLVEQMDENGNITEIPADANCEKCIEFK